MHYYEFMCCGQEGGSILVLTHENRYEAKELQAFVNEAMVLSVLDLADSGHAGEAFITQIGKLWDGAIAQMKAKWGFQSLEFTSSYDAYAWRHLDSDSFDDDDVANSIVDRLASEGFTQAFFQAWRDAHEVCYPDSDVTKEWVFGVNAGTAFRLNEVLGRRVFTRVAEPQWSDD